MILGRRIAAFIVAIGSHFRAMRNAHVCRVHAMPTCVVTVVCMALQKNGDLPLIRNQAQHDVSLTPVSQEILILSLAYPRS